MAVFPKGAAAIREAAAAQKRGGKFARNVFWRDGDKRYVQFLTPINDIPTIKHYSVCVGTTEEGVAMMRDFIDPRPYLGADAYNPIADRWGEKGVKPKTKQAAVVVELEAKRKGGKPSYSVATHTYENKDGQEVEKPNVGVVIQSPNFFSWLATFSEEVGPVEDYVFSIERVEGSSPVKYNFMHVANAVELDEDLYDEIDLDEYLESLMSEDRFRELIDPLPDSAILDKFAQRGKGKKGTSSTGKSKAQVAKETEEVEQEVEQTDADSAFADLKASLKS